MYHCSQFSQRFKYGERNKMEGYMKKLNKRQTVLAKCDGRCAYCGESGHYLAVEHVVPKSQGGSNHISNLLPSCTSCNSSKGVRSLEDFILHQNYLEIVKEQRLSVYQLKFLIENTNFAEVFPANGYVPFFMQGKANE